MNEHIAKYPVIPVMVIEDVDGIAPLGEVLLSHDLPTAEITFRSETALKAMKRMKELYPRILLGAGTVTQKKHIDQGLDMGVDFFVSPGFNPQIVEYGLSKGAFMIPGINNPSLAEQAMAFGLDLLKFYPAEISGGLPMIGALHAVYPQLKLMPTGGIKEANLKDYLSHPMVAACGGSWLTPKKALQEKDWDGIGRIIQKTKEILREI